MLNELQGIPAHGIATFLTSQPVYSQSSKNVIAFIEGQMGGGNSLFTYIDAATYNLSIIVSWINSAEGNCGMFTDLLNWDKSALVNALLSYNDLESLLTQLYNNNNSSFLGIVVDQLEAVYRSTIASLYDLEDLLDHIATYFDQATADAVEEAITINTDALTDFFRLGEHPMYGSSRLGIARSDLAIYWNHVSGTEGSGEHQVSTTDAYRLIGKKHYELSNHLGNVLTVITDKKTEVEDAINPGALAYYKADILSAPGLLSVWDGDDGTIFCYGGLSLRLPGAGKR
ncbi:MAG: hypothetical protein WD077_00850 [Bacteroidia bacterium]